MSKSLGAGIAFESSRSWSPTGLAYNAFGRSQPTGCPCAAGPTCAMTACEFPIADSARAGNG
jgi:hypothetical protein